MKHPHETVLMLGAGIIVGVITHPAPRSYILRDFTVRFSKRVGRYPTMTRAMEEAARLWPSFWVRKDPRSSKGAEVSSPGAHARFQTPRASTSEAGANDD